MKGVVSLRLSWNDVKSSLACLEIDLIQVGATLCAEEAFKPKVRN